MIDSLCLKDGQIIKIGSTIKLKSGGPLMTVFEIQDSKSLIQHEINNISSFLKGSDQYRGEEYQIKNTLDKIKVSLNEVENEIKKIDSLADFTEQESISFIDLFLSYLHDSIIFISGISNYYLENYIRNLDINIKSRINQDILEKLNSITINPKINLSIYDQELELLKNETIKIITNDFNSYLLTYYQKLQSLREILLKIENITDEEHSDILQEDLFPYIRSEWFSGRETQNHRFYLHEIILIEE